MLNGKKDEELGGRVWEYLADRGLVRNTSHVINTSNAKLSIQHGIRDGLASAGVDMGHPSTKDTPIRYAEMLVDELCAGLDWCNFPKCTTVPNDLNYDQMVLVRDIQVTSLCEHHLQTIDGVAHIAYIPGKTVLGLSKFARITEFFARRPQIQERLTEQIFHSLCLILDTSDVAVVINATHYCMKARGVSQQMATTQTDRMGGRFMDKPPLRSEFLNAIR